MGKIKSLITCICLLFFGNPAKLAIADMDADSVREELRTALKLASANNFVIELLMKDNNTLGNNPQNVIDWCRIAREGIEKL